MAKLPDKKKDEQLGAGHVNTLSRAAEIVLNPAFGAYQSQSGARGQSGMPPWLQREIIITDDADAPMYEFRFRYYDSDEEEWKTDEESGPFDLDASSNDQSFAEDDKLTAYWDAQRGSWVPIGSGGCPDNLWSFRLDKYPASGGSFNIRYTLYKNGTSPRTLDMTIDWNETAASFAEKLFEHPAFVDEDPNLELGQTGGSITADNYVIVISGGPLPNYQIFIRTLTGRFDSLPLLLSSSLSNNAFPMFDSYSPEAHPGAV